MKHTRMRRPLIAGAIYHVYARGVRRGLIFIEDIEREAYLEDLEEVARTYEWNVLSYCLMSNHVHLLIETKKPNLDRGMQRLHWLHACRFNRRHKLKGHVFEERYNSPYAQDEGRVQYWAKYIALNPVEAGMVRDQAEYEWSAHAALAGDREPPRFLAVERLLSFFGPEGVDRRGRYAADVEAMRYLGGSEAA